jgi:hypothetical protein
MPIFIPLDEIGWWLSGLMLKYHLQQKSLVGFLAERF